MVDWNNIGNMVAHIITIVGIVIAYHRFKKQLEQKYYEMKLQLIEHSSQTYKELILTERIKRNNLILDSVKNLLVKLNQYSFIMEHKNANRIHFERLEKEYRLGNIKAVDFDNLYEKTIDVDDQDSTRMEECIDCIDQEFYFLSVVFGSKYSKDFSSIRKHITHYTVKGYQIKSASNQKCLLLEKELDMIERELISLFTKLVDEDWTDITQQAKDVFPVKGWGESK